MITISHSIPHYSSDHKTLQAQNRHSDHGDSSIGMSSGEPEEEVLEHGVGVPGRHPALGEALLHLHRLQAVWLRQPYPSLI